MLRIVLSIFIPQHGVNSSEFHRILLSIPSIFSTALSNASMWYWYGLGQAPFCVNTE